MNEEKKKIRALIANPGFDGHWKGAKVTMALRDAGMEVVYVGNQTPQAIHKTALQEDVDVIGLNLLTPEGKSLILEALKILQEEKTKDILVIVGADLPPEEITYLKNLGVGEVFSLRVDVNLVVDYVKNNVI
ncbi:MAG: cobalamin B12-binding domain-containing protein [Peptococcaceae bacterium]